MNNTITKNELIKNITPKNDYIFKRIFGSPGNECILKDFLEAILNININSLKLDLNTELLPDQYEGKTSRLDVLCELDDMTLVDIEIQVDTSKFSEERCLEYWSRLYTKALKKGHNYAKLSKTIGIWILDGEVFREFKDFHSNWKIGETKYGFLGHFEHLELHIIELQKFRNLDIIEPKKKEFWLSFIDQTKKELMEMGKLTNERINEAYKQYTEITSDDKLMVAIINKMMAESDQITSVEKAREAGIKEGKIEAAKKLLKLNMNIEQIIDITGLSKEEIESLK